MLLQTLDSQPVSIEAFRLSAQQSRALKLTQDQQLLLYALYKQATEDDAPDVISESNDIASSYKHDAWASLRGFPREGAMRAYVHLVEDLASSQTEGSGTADVKINNQDSEGFGSVFSTLM